MPFLISLTMFVSLILTGCQSGSYHVQKEEYKAQVKTLGVLPVLVDRGSRVDHSQPEQVFHVLERSVVGRETALIDALRKTKRYFDVRQVKTDPRTSMAELLQIDRQNVGAAVNRYRVAGSKVAELSQEAVVDALLLVVMRGVNRVEKRYDRKSFDYLEDSYNRIEADALVVLPDGRIAWEYPSEGGDKVIDLFYPDFDEAHFNRTDQVRQHEMTLEGIERQLQAEGDPIGQSVEKIATALSRPDLKIWP